jgi:hypothetical protein
MARFARIGVVLFLAAALLFAAVALPSAFALDGHLFVIGGGNRNASNPGDDQPMLNTLTGLGLTYSYVNSNVVKNSADPAALVAGHDLIYISESIGSNEGSDLDDALGSLDVPLIHAEVGVNPAFGMARQPGANFDIDQVTIADDALAAANGLSGTVVIFTRAGEIIHSDPEPEATVVARCINDDVPPALIACVFYYDKGDRMIDRIAPNKRGFWLANRAGFTLLNAAGIQLFEGLLGYFLAPAEETAVAPDQWTLYP